MHKSGLPQGGSPGFGPFLELPRTPGPWHRVVSFPAVTGCAPLQHSLGQSVLPANTSCRQPFIREVAEGFLGLPLRVLLGRGAHSRTGAPTVMLPTAPVGTSEVKDVHDGVLLGADRCSVWWRFLHDSDVSCRSLCCAERLELQRGTHSIVRDFGRCCPPQKATCWLTIWLRDRSSVSYSSAQSSRSGKALSANILRSAARSPQGSDLRCLLT